MRVVIFGCGYVGVLLGQELVRAGHQVVGVNRMVPTDAESLASGIEFVCADVIQAEALAAVSGGFDWVVLDVAAETADAKEAERRRLGLEGCRNITNWMLGQTIKKAVLLSCVSVYGQTDGSKVNEMSPTVPLTAQGQLWLEIERVWLGAVERSKVPGVVVRAAEVYGPGRVERIREFVAREARVWGRGEQLINMIHRQDVVGCMRGVLQSGRVGDVYNAVDDEPVTELYLLRWLSETLGEDMPPAAEVGAVLGSRGGGTLKRVSNRKIKAEIGYVFKSPTFRQGYTAEIRRMEEE